MGSMTVTTVEYPTIKKGMTGSQVLDVMAKRKEIDKQETLKQKRLEAQQLQEEQRQKELKDLRTEAISLGIKVSNTDKVADLHKKISDKYKLIEKQTKETIKSNIKSDKNKGILTEKKGKKFLWFQITKDKVVFNPAKFAAQYGRDLKLGDISARYGLEEGALKKANNLRFEVGQMKAGKGNNLNNYTPADLNRDELNIPIV